MLALVIALAFLALGFVLLFALNSWLKGNEAEGLFRGSVTKSDSFFGGRNNSSLRIFKDRLEIEGDPQGKILTLTHDEVQSVEPWWPAPLLKNSIQITLTGKDRGVVIWFSCANLTTKGLYPRLREFGWLSQSKK